MKVQIMHDSKGNIVGGGSSPVGAQLRPRKGHSITEVEVSHVKKADDVEALHKVLKSQRIEIESKKLVPK